MENNCLFPGCGGGLDWCNKEDNGECPGCESVERDAKKDKSSEGYPKDWVHVTVHFKPDTRTVHYDGKLGSITAVSNYLKELKERAEKAEAENARLRAALFCETCHGHHINIILEAYHGGGASYSWDTCPTCGPIREALRGDTK